jgi:hypothetical protein
VLGVAESGGAGAATEPVSSVASVGARRKLLFPSPSPPSSLPSPSFPSSRRALSQISDPAADVTLVVRTGSSERALIAQDDLDAAVTSGALRVRERERERTDK